MALPLLIPSPSLRVHRAGLSQSNTVPKPVVEYSGPKMSYSGPPRPPGSILEVRLTHCIFWGVLLRVGGVRVEGDRNGLGGMMVVRGGRGVRPVVPVSFAIKSCSTICVQMVHC